MATQVQHRRGTSAQHTSFTGAVGEITVDTDRKTAVVHDASTAGGIPLARQDTVNNKVAVVTSNSNSRIWANTITDAASSKNVFIDLATSGVTAATYGSATNIPIVTIDAYGRVTTAANVAVNGMDYPYANVIWNTANASLQNVSGTVFRGDIYFANGNVGIGIASASPTTIYVKGSSASVMNTLVDGATITPIFGGTAGNNNFTVTLGGNRTVANPTQPTVGQSGVIYLVQDSTGSRTLSWANTWKFQGNTAPTLSTSANSVDMLVYAVRTTANIACQLITNIG